MIKKNLQELKNTEEIAHDDVVSADLFLKTKDKKNKYMFISDIEKKSKKSDEHIDYQNLVNKKYPEEVYKKFLKQIFSTENIIVEELDNVQVLEKIANNPQKCFSNRNVFHDKHINVDYEKEDNDIEEEDEDDNDDKIVNYSPDQDKETSLENFSNKTHIDTKKEEESSLFMNSMTYVKDTSMSSLNSTIENDIKNMTPKQIQELIEQKMKKLDKFNDKISMKEVNNLKKKYFLTDDHISKLIKFQKHFKSYLIRRNFFKAIEMNKYLEHKKKFLQLKKSLQKFEKFLKENPSYTKDTVNPSININYYFK